MILHVDEAGLVDRVEVVVVLDLAVLHEVGLRDAKVLGRVVHVGVVAQVATERRVLGMVLRGRATQLARAATARRICLAGIGACVCVRGVGGGVCARGGGCAFDHRRGALERQAAVVNGQRSL